MSASAVSTATPINAMDMLTSTSAAAKAKAKANAATSGTSAGTALGGTTAGTTFLNLLVKELQNQDPTAPMDSTAMVGQMISLNQLDQLISINQTLSTASTSSSGTSSTASSHAVVAARAALMNGISAPTTAQTATLAASDPNSTLDFSSLNNPYGGK